MKNFVLHIGQQLRTKKMHSWHIGALLASYNMGLICVMIVLSLVSLNSSLWVYLLLLSPILFSAFWIWFSQQILHFYGHLSIHDAVITAKVGILPFLVVFLASAVGLAVVAYMPDVPQWWATASYYGVLFGGGSIGLELTVVVFGLRHRLPSQG